MPKLPPVLLINTLEEFYQEIAAPAVVRLNLTQKNGFIGKEYPIHTTTIMLNLQGVNSQDQIVWLHDNFEAKRTGDRGFFSQSEECIFKQFEVYHALVSAHLTLKQGYTVRGGQFGIDHNIKPIKGIFECVEWVKDGDKYILEPTRKGGDNDTDN